MYPDNQTKKGIVVVATFIVFILTIFSFNQDKKEAYYPEKIKVILREVGNNMLLANNDSVSLIMPIKHITENEFEISFQKELSIDPDILVDNVNSLVPESNMVQDYIIEVVNCKNNDVAYSYQVTKIDHGTIIPCSGRILPKSCYHIRCVFLPQKKSQIKENMYPIATLAILIMFVSGSFFFSQKGKVPSTKPSMGSIKLGKYTFRINEQILQYEKECIRLTAKETHLLKIFYESPNEIIKRERLEKEVWEDNGVIVGRSLDMFISKLRKKLSQDPSIKIVNIHGVGYKMEI